ncbi:MAG: iron uptake porin [Cyanobacteriota bacterium]|nr:iron uptake porin [Cyanobacteriota bacterium]
MAKDLAPSLKSDLKLSEVQTSEPIELSQTAIEPASSVSVDEFMQVTEQQSLGESEQTSVDSISQVTSISQLSDVQPTDWAFQALQSLVERYGCIAGYPDGTYRGNQATTRYEFAAGLNACLDQILNLVDIESEVTAEDLAVIRRLQEEFAAELATLRGRVDALEARTAELEANQFSTTTKLIGEVVFGVADSFGDTEETVGLDQTVFQDRVRLNFVTNFDEKQQLWTRLDASNATPLTNSGIGATTYQTADSGNDVGIGWLAYYYNGDNFQVYLPAAFPLWQDFVPTVSPYFEGFTGANNSITSFGESNPIYKIGLASGGGLGLNYFVGDNVTVSAGYFGGDSFDPSEGSGLFNGEYSMLGQLTFSSGKLELGLTYVHAYFNDFGGGGIGDVDGNAIFDTLVGTSAARNPFDVATITNSYGASAAYQLSESISVSAFGGYTDAFEAGGAADAEIWYYGLGFAFPDLGGDGNLLGIQAGAEPYVGGIDFGGANIAGDDVPLSIQAFYRYAVNDYINITPGVVALFNPGGFGDLDEPLDSDPIVIGVLRTTFNF